MIKHRALCAALLCALFSVPAGATPFNSLSMDVGVCDPNAPQNCIKPDASGNVPITGSITASLAGFHPETALSPLAVTTSSGTSGTFTAGKVVVVTNVGTTNTAYCLQGVVATTQVQAITPNGGWFAFTTTSETAISCITSTGTTTVNLLVGTGLPTGTGGGGGSGGGGAVTIANGADVALGTTTDAVAATPASGTAATLIALAKAINNNVAAAIPAGTATIGTTGSLPYPVGAVPYTATATGTTAATTATLAGAASVTTYICGFSIRANATAAATGNATVTGVITATMNFTQWTAPNASGLGITEMIFAPCIPASATNTSVAVVSAAPGTGGVVSVTAWGYKL